MAAFNADGTLTNGGSAVAKPNTNLNFIQRHLNEIGGGGGAVAGGLTGAAIGSVVPVVGTAIGGLIGAGLGGLAGGAAGEYGKQAAQGNTGPQANEEVRKQALIQGAYGLGGEVGGQVIGHGLGALSSLLGRGGEATAETASEAAPNFLQRAGKALNQSVINPIVKASPTGAAEEARVAEEASKLLPTGSAAAKYKAMPQVMSDLGNQLNSAIAANEARLPVSQLADHITADLGDLAKYPADAGTSEGKAFLGAVNSHIDSLTARASEDGTLGVKDIVEARRQAADAAQGAFKKLASGSTLTPRDEAAMGVWQHLSDTLNQLAPEAKDIISKQSVLYKAAPGLAKNAKATAGVPLLGVKSKAVARGVQAATDVAGNALKPIGAATGALGRLTGDVLSSRPGAQTAVRLIGDNLTQPTSQPSSDQTSSPLDTGTTGATPANQGVFSPEVLQALAINDLQKTGGKNLGQIATLSSLFGPQGKANAGQNLSTAQQKSSDDIQNALSLLDAADTQVQQLGGVKGPAGFATHIPVLGQYINPKAAAYNATKIDIAGALVKALTGSARNASLIKSFENSLPNVEDRPEVAAQKLDNLRLELNKRATGLGLPTQ